MAHGDVHWSELATSDPAAAKAFFQATAGWTVTEMPMPNGPYWICMVGETPVAGIMDLKQLDDPAAPPNWTTYVAVDDIDAVVDRTPGLGGTVVVPPFDVPGVGRIAILKDPTGARIGMMTPAGG